MLTINPQYITDKSGRKISVVIPLNDFNAILEELEELEDIKLYDEAKKIMSLLFQLMKHLESLKPNAITSNGCLQRKLKEGSNESPGRNKRTYYSSIKEAIYSLAHNPRPHGYIKLKGRAGYRIRVANYRIVYDVFDEVLLVEVINLGHRKDIYE